MVTKSIAWALGASFYAHHVPLVIYTFYTDCYSYALLGMLLLTLLLLLLLMMMMAPRAPLCRCNIKIYILWLSSLSLILQYFFSSHSRRMQFPFVRSDSIYYIYRNIVENNWNIAYLYALYGTYHAYARKRRNSF